MTFKPGDKVRIKQNAKELTERVIGWFDQKDSMVGKVCEINYVDMIGCRLWDKEKAESWYFSIDSVEPIEKTFETLEVGDVLVDEDGLERTVLAVLPGLIGLNRMYKPEEFGDFYTLHELDGIGYTIKQEPKEPEVIEMTVPEAEATIERYVGSKVKIIK